MGRSNAQRDVSIQIRNLQCMKASVDLAVRCTGRFESHRLSFGHYSCQRVPPQVARQGTLLRISFETLFEYLQFLKVTAGCLRCCGRHAAFYLAAAVSDFYIPWSQMVTPSSLDHPLRRMSHSTLSQSYALFHASMSSLLPKTKYVIGDICG